VRPLLFLQALIGIVLGVTTPARAGAPQADMAAMPVKPAVPDSAWPVVRVSKRGCVDTSAIAGAMVMDSRTLELVMRGGQRLRLLFARDCPQLSYYGGFYYRPDSAGRLCAGRDRLMGRDGGNCPIAAVATLRRPR
jgi:hypothetical protein